MPDSELEFTTVSSGVLQRVGIHNSELGCMTVSWVSQQ